jgi:voltage-gated potassium channel
MPPSTSLARGADGSPFGSAAARPASKGCEEPVTAAERWAGYDALMLGFSLLAIGMLVVGVAVELGPSSRSILAYADTAVCLVFLTDFIVSLMRAENRWQYMVRWGWLDLISSIPVLDAARLGRAARVVRILRVIRGVKATRMIAAMLFQQRALNAVMAGAFVAILAIFASSFAILSFEENANGTIKNADDAVWWAICTVTTVGYGDYYPVTWEGRIVAFFLMITGAATFGALAGLLASWFMGTEDAADNAELRQVRQELAAVRVLLEERLGSESSFKGRLAPEESGRDDSAAWPRSKAA